EICRKGRKGKNTAKQLMDWSKKDGLEGMEKTAMGVTELGFFRVKKGGVFATSATCQKTPPKTKKATGDARWGKTHLNAWNFFLKSTAYRDCENVVFSKNPT